jgi:hypothetical protein
MSAFIALPATLHFENCNLSYLDHSNFNHNTTLYSLAMLLSSVSQLDRKRESVTS